MEQPFSNYHLFCSVKPVNKDHTWETNIWSLLRGGPYSKVNLYYKRPFENTSTWSLFAGCFYSKVVFQAGLTVLIALALIYIWLAYLFKVNKATGLSPGSYTNKYAAKCAKKRKRVQERSQLPSTKRRRLQLKQERVINNVAKEALEGQSYQSGKYSYVTVKPVISDHILRKCIDHWRQHQK